MRAVGSRLNLVNPGSRASVYLDLIRFVAAAIVVLSHLGTPDWSTGPLFIWKQITSLGFPSVIIFFVLSGYFISSSVLKMQDSGRWSWRDYLINRGTRLWIVLIPALLLTLFWGVLQSQLYGQEYTREGVAMTDALSIKYFFSNLVFMQHIYSPTFGLNNPLWSLSFEFWYYILFPCLLLVFKAKTKRGKVLSFIVFSSISLFVGWKVMLYFLIWLLGAVVAIIKPIKLKNMFVKILLVVGTLMAAIMVSIAPKAFNIYPTYYLPLKQYGFDFALGLVAAFLVYMIISFYNLSNTSRPAAVFTNLAGFSYTLYLVHYPVINFISKASGRKAAGSSDFIWQQSTTNYFLYLPIVFTALLLYAWLISLITEAKTSGAREIVSRVIGNMKKNRAPSVSVVESYEK
ncbi:acyltransferase family protein [Paenibacillus herberti]|nr:acyltransferase [Paenibacillus herberti]